MKGWIRDVAPQYGDHVEVKYVGGDPRFVFISTYEEICSKLNPETGELEVIGVGTIETQSEETKMNDYNGEGIDRFLNERGFFKKGSEPSGYESPAQWKREEL